MLRLEAGRVDRELLQVEARREDALATGQALEFDGRSWRISGTFAAGGGTFESEIWCRLDDLQLRLQPAEIVLAAVTGAYDV